MIKLVFIEVIRVLLKALCLKEDFVQVFQANGCLWATLQWHYNCVGFNKLNYELNELKPLLIILANHRGVPLLMPQIELGSLLGADLNNNYKKNIFTLLVYDFYVF